jgi:hypothetical protein
VLVSRLLSSLWAGGRGSVISMLAVGSIHRPLSHGETLCTVGWKPLMSWIHQDLIDLFCSKGLDTKVLRVDGCNRACRAIGFAWKGLVGRFSVLTVVITHVVPVGSLIFLIIIGLVVLNLVDQPSLDLAIDLFWATLVSQINET